MAGPNFVLDKGYIADGAVRQFRCVELVSNEHCDEVDTAGDFVIGVCQEEISADDATNGRVADIRIMGISRAIAGAALTVGTRVRSDAEGRLVGLAAATINQNQVGIIVTASAATGDQCDVLLTPGVQADLA